MSLITEYTSFEDAQKYYAKEKLWELFDGTRESINIAHECVDRHPREQIAVQIAIDDGGSEIITFGELSDWSGRYANYIRSRGIQAGERCPLASWPCDGGVPWRSGGLQEHQDQKDFPLMVL